MTDVPRITKFEHFARITQAASGISIILGIIIGLTQIYKTSVRELVKEDTAIRQEMTTFLENYDKEKLEKALGSGDLESAYYSPSLAPLRDVGHHYEEMGALVKSDYVDFDLVFELIPFPDNFWELTAPVRERARTNWSKGEGLSDFWRNFTYLQCRYQTRRHGKPEPSNICRENP
jgi:hypothetical protein